MVLKTPQSRRKKYKTYLLDGTVFEVERRYNVEEVIGYGAYGIVCSGYDLKYDSKDVAIKKIDGIRKHIKFAKRTLREIKFLRIFDHENIIPIRRIMRPRSLKPISSIYVVTDLMETDLTSIIRSDQNLSDDHCRFFLYQVLRALKYIHSADVIHRDIKPRNVLINSNCDVRLCDFGLARFVGPDVKLNSRTHMSDYVQTRWYRAPEVILDTGNYTKAVDMWSVGCVLAELIGRRPFFPGRDSFHQVQIILQLLGFDRNTTWNDCEALKKIPTLPGVNLHKVFPRANPLAVDLVSKLLKVNPRDRLTVEEALEHPYFADLHFEEDEPTCSKLDSTEFEFEEQNLGLDEMEELIREECLSFYPEDTFRDDECADVIILKLKKTQRTEKGVSSR